MKMIQKSLLSLIIMTIAGTCAQAATSIDVKVIGTITPPACVPDIGGGATFDYGTIAPNSLSKTALTPLDVKTTSFVIQCTAPARVAIRATNGRTGSAAGVTERATGAAAAPAALGWNDYNVVGLGMSDGEKIGGYTLYLRGSPTVDTKSVTVIESDDSGVTWNATGTKSLYGATDVKRLLTVAQGGTSTPLAFETLEGTIAVQGYINNTSSLAVNKVVKLDGLTTLEMVYLP
ncbi:DUF1120 domain-containing protein [Enterobacteriaceae bacterium 89]|nr:DUF1120 domain-containing protein [Enterobacteriaceae bacterium 89]